MPARLGKCSWARNFTSERRSGYDTPSTGGTAIDAGGNLYVSDVNQHRILKITPEKRISVLLSDPRLIWADALWIDSQGNLWIPQAQLSRLASFNGGVSRVQLPFYIFRMPTNARQFLGVPAKAGTRSRGQQ